MGEIGVDHQGVAVILSPRRPHTPGVTAPEEDFGDRLIDMNLRAHFASQTSHHLRDGAATANRMPDAVLVLEE